MYYVEVTSPSATIQAQRGAHLSTPGVDEVLRAGDGGRIAVAGTRLPGFAVERRGVDSGPLNARGSS
jgi:hypothetical protein